MYTDTEEGFDESKSNVEKSQYVINIVKPSKDVEFEDYFEKKNKMPPTPSNIKPPGRTIIYWGFKNSWMKAALKEKIRTFILWQKEKVRVEAEPLRDLGKIVKSGAKKLYLGVAPLFRTRYLRYLSRVKSQLIVNKIPNKYK